MLRFRLGSIPVQVHYSHFLVAAILGMGSGDGSGAEIARRIALWVVVVFVSVMIHELGHALTAKGFGYRPDIQLYWLGGFTRPNSPKPLPWGQDVLVTLAGPAAGAALGLACGAAADLPSLPAWLQSALVTFEIANFFWAALNLIPVPPLDGGHVSMAILRRLFGRNGELAALGLGCALGLGLGLVAGKLGMLSIAVLLAFYGFRAGSMFMTRRQKPETVAPADQALGHAQALLDSGKLDEARTLAEQVISQPSSALLCARAHRILGWVELKRGEGRLALDHFAQVQSLPVEPEALAAAFSLVGDEGRALQLWELAYSNHPNRTLLHEWAGALIRAGSAERALSLKGVQPSLAYSCAERVLFLRGDFAGAARLGEEGLRVAPSPGSAYDTACAYSRGGQPEDAMRMLQRAIELGFSDYDHLTTDADLELLRTHPAWDALLERIRKSGNR